MFRRFLSILVTLVLFCVSASAEFSTDVEAINLAAKSMVVLENINGEKSAGVVVGEGLILSASIITENLDDWTVWTEDGSSLDIAFLIKNNPSTGIVLSSLSGESILPSIPLASGSQLLRGETVTVLGSPLGQSCSVTTGTVGAVFEDRGVTWIQINAALAGSASGVLMDESGHMVGMITSAYDNGAGAARGIYYAVSSEYLPVNIPEETPVPTVEPTSSPAPTPSPSPVPTPSPSPTPAPTHDPDNWVLVDNDDFRIEVTGFFFKRYSSGSTYLYMYANVDNRTGHTVDIYLNDASINGTAVDANGILDIPGHSSFTKSKESDGFFFLPLTEDDTLAIDQMQDPRTLSFEVKMLDSYDYEKLYSTFITINGPEALEMQTPAPTAVPTLMPFYPYLVKGDKGDDVRKMQERLIALGYLSDSADGIYGNNTAQAVYDFRDQNDLTSVSDKYAADREMQAVLFSTKAKRYTEPYYGLVIPDVSYGEWKYVNDNKLGMRIQVKNITKTQTIKAFELYMYATDVYGDRLYGSDTVYYGTTTKNVGPGKTVYSDYIYLPDRRDIDKVYVAISKIVYSDGTVREHYTYDYFNWTID